MSIGQTSIRLVTALLAFFIGVAVTLCWMLLPPSQGLLKQSNMGSWIVKVNTSGGLGGLGEGGWMVASQGHIFVGTKPETMEPFITYHYSCKGYLPPESFHNLDQAVRSANPAKWASRYVNPKYPYGYNDGIGVGIELHHYLADGSKKIYTTSWSDSAEGLLPGDIKAIYERSRMGMLNIRQQCGEYRE